MVRSSRGGPVRRQGVGRLPAQGGGWGTGAKAYDYSSNLNHGTLINGPVWIESYLWDKGLFAHYKLNGNTRDSNGNTIGQSIGTEFSEDRHGYTKGTAKFTGNGWINLNKTSSKESATSLGLPKRISLYQHG